MGTIPELDARIAEAAKAAAEAIKRASVVLRDALCQTAYLLGCVVHEMVAAARRVVVPPRWAHLARYGRKRRTREKYRRMISRLYTGLLGAVTAT